MNEWNWSSWYWFFHLEFKFLILFPGLLFCGQFLSPAGSSATVFFSSQPPHPHSKQCRGRSDRNPEDISESGGSWAQGLSTGVSGSPHLPLGTSAMKKQKPCQLLWQLSQPFVFLKGKPHSSSAFRWRSHFCLPTIFVVVVQTPSHVQLFATPWTAGLQHARLLCLSPSPGACSNSGPWCQWCHPTIPSSVTPFSSPPALNLCQHQGLFQWAGSSHQVAKVLELQFQHQFFVLDTNLKY